MEVFRRHGEEAGDFTPRAQVVGGPGFDPIPDGVPDYAYGIDPGFTPFLQVVSGATGLPVYSVDFTGMAFLPVEVALVGDLTGDGISEIAAGWPVDFGGTLRVYEGAGPGNLLFEVGSPAGAFGFGWDLVGPGDLSGDGVPDILVGAPASDNGVGRVVAVSGADGTILWELLGLDPSPAAATGTRLAAPGDVNGDGVPDFAVSHPGSDVGGVDSGRITIHSGLALVTLASFEGLPGERFGEQALEAVGDLDGDGIEDLLASTRTEWWLISTVRALSGANGSLLWEAQNSLGFGYALAGVGDWNRDGTADVAVSAPGRGLDMNDDVIYIRSGVDGQEIYRIADEEGTRVLFGVDLASAGDLDGDGTSELLALERYSTQVLRHNPFLLLPDGGEISASAGGIQGLALDFPEDAAFYAYQTLFSQAGPGSTSVYGLEVPLAFDEFFLRSFLGDYGFLPYAGGLAGTLDANGDGAAFVGHPGGLPASFVGMTMAVATIAGPTGLPPVYSSMAGTLTVVP